MCRNCQIKGLPNDLAREYWTDDDAELKTDYDQRKARREAYAKENGR